MSHWRETFKPARFSIMDARAGVPLLATLLHLRVWTVAICITIIIVFLLLERRGLSLPSAFRAFRAWIIGDARPPLTHQKVRGHIDFGRRDL